MESCPVHHPIDCPAEGILRLIAGKWKPQILRLAHNAPLRFNALVKQLPGSNKQSVASALRELEEAGILSKKVIKLKPLHIEYYITEKGQGLLPVFQHLNSLI